MSLKKGPLWVAAFDGGRAWVFLQSGARAAPELELLAAPQALGMARPRMSPALKQRLVAEADKDMANEPPEVIARHVGHLLMPD